MTELGIRSLMDKPCHAISGGELQMVLIARAMAAEPELLVLDEPESNLDFKNQLIVLDAMSALAAKGVACIFNTHYPAHALQRADKSLLLFKGAAGEASSGAGAGPDSETTCAAGASFGAGADRGAVTALGTGAGDSGCVFGITSEVVTEENIRRAFGVDALIGEVETPRSVMKSIIPVGIARSGSAAAGAETSGRCLASTTMISDTNDAAGRINSLLSEYDHLIIGRMGLPCRSSGKYIITVMLEGPGKDIATLTHRLSLIQGISVKTTYE